jgi:capsular exopolysaccharide synthesis family protein
LEQDHDQYTPVDLREYIGVIRARKWSIILVTLLVLGLALAYSYRQDPVYRAQSRLLLKPMPSTGYFPSQSLETESQLLRSDLVATEAAKVMGRPDASGLLGGISATGIPESQVLEIFYTSSDPQLAADAANAFAEGFIIYQESQANRTLELQRADITVQLEEVQADLDKVLRAVEATPETETAKLGQLAVQQNGLSARLGLLQQQLDQLDQPGASTGEDGGDIIQAASVPGSPYAPNHLANGLMGLFLGVALGLAFAFLRQRLDDTFRGRSEVERVVQAPVLATIPKIKGRKALPDRLVVIRDPRGPAAEAYRALRTGIIFASRQHDLHTLAVTSPREGEGKTLTTANLAAAIGQTGQKVALISADMRRPTLERYFALTSTSQSGGLSSWLTGDDQEPPVLIATEADNVDILPCGPIPHNPGELLTSPRLVELVAHLKENYDIVIFDTPPVLPVADVATLASILDGTLLVLDAATTHRSTAADAREELARVGVNIVGTLLNAFDPSVSNYYYYAPYHSSKGYSSTYVSNGEGRRKSDKRRFRSSR